MKRKRSNERLDEILIKEGFVTEAQIEEALQRQKAYGGKLGSQLLYFRSITEGHLVRALCLQLDCLGVTLSSRQISPDVIKMVPTDVALARNVIPFGYDLKRKLLRVACEDPTDETLARELKFITGCKHVRLYVAAQISLSTSLSKYYMGEDVSLDDNLLVEISEDALVVDEHASSREDTEVEGAGEGTIRDELFVKNLDLLTSLLSSKAKFAINHGSQVGQYADQLCRRLKLPVGDRLIVCNAAYLHDLARLYYSAEEIGDHLQTIQLTIKLLASLNYSPAVLQILRSAHARLDQDDVDRTPLDVLGGSILTVVDLFCHAIPHSERLSLDKLDAIKVKLQRLSGKLFLEQVAEEFIELMRERILDPRTSLRTLQVMLCSLDSVALKPLQLRLKNEGFATVFLDSAASMIELYKRSEPDLIVLAASGTPEETFAFADELEDGGVSFELTPTFLLADASSVSRLTGLLDRGIEDILVLEENLDLLVSKIQKLKLRMNGEDRVTILESRTSGRLADMNLIDLVQALGPARKTAKITIQPDHYQERKLTMYLCHGSIVFAEFGGLTGAAAVYEALSWTHGAWSVEPVETGEIPPPNNDLSNESILMEGCRLMDEKARTKNPL
ncbi:MAG: hypothetical protein AMJ46_08370 [Latescibacteria bacterium DG_63]|nr:MAG: hypothetical protein AMJ46_08370 [Latescibacteria bacterium DG_63]